MCTICAALNPANLSAEDVSHAYAYGGLGPVSPRVPRTPAGATLDALAGQLTTGYWAANGGGVRSYALGDDRQITVNLTGLDAATQFVARAALAAWSDVTGINFVDSASAQITFADDDAGAYSYSQIYGNSILYSVVNVNSTWDSDPPSVNSYWFQTYVHEIGHALGLGHAGNYNGNAVWGRDNKYSNDSWQASVMSYFSQVENTNTGSASFAFTATAMAADIIAIQALYGTNVQTRAGNTVYGNNSNVDGYLGDLFDQWMGGAADTDAIYIGNNLTLTIFDTGGIDTLDVSGTSIAQRVDLNAEAKSDVAGLKGNVIIARGTVVENAVGGFGNDTLAGNAGGNSLSGGDGADVLDGRAGNDTLFGGNGNDTLLGNAGADLMFGGTGADRFDGGSEVDAVTYETSGGGLVIDMMAANASTGDAFGDTFVAIEMIIAGSGSDIVRGATGAEILRGMNSADQIFGRAGNDTLDGGEGDDVLYGGQGADVHIGGVGRDRADYSEAGRGITVAIGAVSAELPMHSVEQAIAFISSFDSGLSFGGFGGSPAPTGRGGRRGRGGRSGSDSTGDTFDSVEDLAGSAHNDSLTGSADANAIWGNNGNDTINGGLGNDTLTGGAGSDTFVFNGGTDTVTDFLDNIDTVAIARSLFGSSSVSVAQALAFATVEAGNIVFRFNLVDTFILAGQTDVAILQDDLIFV